MATERPLPGGGTTTLGGGTAISGGGTPDRGGGTPFRLNLTTDLRGPTSKEREEENKRQTSLFVLLPNLRINIL